MDVRELMRSPVATVYEDDTLACVAKIMRDRAVGCVPVIDTDGRLTGIITDRDIALTAYDVGEALWRLRVAEWMHRPVHTCRAGDGVDVAARMMRQHRVRRLPVVDDAGRPIAMLSLDDLVHASRQPILSPEPGLTADEIDDTFQAVSGRSRHARPEAHK
jgi:CBS domain-containing protein